MGTRWENDEEPVSFDDWKKTMQEMEDKAEEARKKAKKEEEDKREAERRKARKARAAAKKREEEEEDEDDDELTEKELQMLRGYKKTSDGRTTSYFTREQTEEEKKLLGDIAPQRLAANEQSFAPQRLEPGSAAANKSASAWNQAGTWEEKNTSDWCQSSLKKHLECSKAELNPYVARVTEVAKMTGHASVAFASGKKHYVFEYDAIIKFEIIAAGGKGKTRIGKGEIYCPDISSATVDEELEVQVRPWEDTPSEQHRPGAFKCADVLVDQIRKQVSAFVSDFNSEY